MPRKRATFHILQQVYENIMIHFMQLSGYLNEDMALSWITTEINVYKVYTYNYGYILNLHL